MFLNLLKVIQIYIVSVIQNLRQEKEKSVFLSFHLHCCFLQK